MHNLENSNCEREAGECVHGTVQSNEIEQRISELSRIRKRDRMLPKSRDHSHRSIVDDEFWHSVGRASLVAG